MGRVVAESTQALVICEVVGDKRRIAHVNREFERLTGWERASALEQSLSTLLRPPGGQFEWERVEAVMLGRSSWRKTLPTARRDGTVFWADLHLYFITDDQAAITHWVGVISDVTEHLELHDALRQSEAQHRLLAENIRDLITVSRADGICVFASSSCRAMLGYEPEEFVGHSLRHLLHPEDHQPARQLLDEHFQGRGESVFIHRVRRKDGSFMWAETTSKVRRDPASQQPTELVSTTRDITKRRQAEDNLKSMHKLLDSVYEAVPIGLCLLDQAGQMLQCNHAFARLFGVTPDSIVARFADNFLPPREFARASIVQGAACECECRTMQGDVFPAELTVVALETGSAHRLVILSDLRERRKMETRLREASQLESLGTLAGGIAHDFNNMLAIVLGYSSLLRDAASDPARIAHYADTIIDAGRRGADVVRQLQLFASMQDAEYSEVNVHALLEETLNRTCADWPAQIQVARGLAASDPMLTADAIQLTQAVQKVLENARDVLPKGGNIWVRTSEVRQAFFAPGSTVAEQKNYLRVSIADNGPGMDAATRARMFEPFFARQKTSEMRGLGLAVVYGIMRAHRGLIEVDSAPGQGTTVHLLFPRAAAKVEAAIAPPPEPFTAGTDRRAILLVEDEQDIGALWLEVLPADGWRVLWARDGGEAIRLFRAHRDEIAIVFTDIGLPVLDGWQVAETIRAEMPGMPLLIASGAFRAGDRHRGLAEPVAYLAKPYVPTKVLRQIRALLPA